MDTNLAPVPGRLLKPEEILQGGGRKCSYSVDNADWGGELRRFKYGPKSLYFTEYSVLMLSLF